MSSPLDLPISIVSDIIKNHLGIFLRLKNLLDNEVLLSKNTKIAFSRIGGIFILYLSNL